MHAIETIVLDAWMAERGEGSTPGDRCLIGPLSVSRKRHANAEEFVRNTLRGTTLP